MEYIELLSLTISLVALAVSGYLTYEANKKADQSILLSQQTTKFDAVMHFTDRFFELLKVGKVDETDASLHRKILNDSTWAYQFWSLHATEFYFFHNRVLPEFMYSLWMVDLAEMYASEQGEQIWKSHLKYLSNYSMHYEKMCEFYEQLYGLAKSARSQDEKNKSIADFVHTWREKNPPPQLEQTAFAQ
jgi:hypothetical protein